jgi:nitroimidazol reductase NimA-like FMN-containing flavoprotein (pyridoxamine 5'-phosphate oxidase superfamily)
VTLFSGAETRWSADDDDGLVALDSAGFEILGRAQCLSLLSEATLGRVAVTIGALPAIFPVNFCMVAGQVVFRSGEGTKLTAALSGTIVAFEADWASEPDGEVWSVQIVGPSRVVDPAADRVAAELAALKSWAPVPRRYLVKITPERISGRRLRSRLRPD